MNENLGDKMISVREIFETMLGKEHSAEVLKLVQIEYDKGTRGVEFLEAVTKIMSRVYAKGTLYECAQRSSIAIVVGPNFGEF